LFWAETSLESWESDRRRVHIIIDGHTHIGHSAYGRGASAEESLRLMERYGIQKAVTLSIQGDHRLNQTVTRFQKQYPQHFVAFVAPTARELCDRHAMDSLVEGSGCKGIGEIYLAGSTEEPPSSNMAMLMETAEQHRLAVLFHTGNLPNSTPLAVGTLAAEYGKVPIILGHMGKNLFARDAIEAARKFRNIYLETSGMPYPRIIEEALGRVGADRVLFGSDYPYWHPAVELKRIEVLNLLKEEKRLILGANIAKVLQLE